MIIVENQLNKSIKARRTDRGSEYLFGKFKRLCDEKGIKRQVMMYIATKWHGGKEKSNATGDG